MCCHWDRWEDLFCLFFNVSRATSGLRSGDVVSIDISSKVYGKQSPSFDYVNFYENVYIYIYIRVVTNG